ncbi:MnmC family methyltransferase [Engelhardtia mirabilis]|uniref:tRNA 5-methylaminomethyl-2-thiouridine biosynthesis bifunctional protein MnmC n=1 Tax=Engelhardtia mirabilis TaxID=2528011 RepID=A0A518BJM3_9BACT|nr:tRNA 5-methylaminomethyl-2-thiouridine biosynthesis bifunctional protein MnmC [Planctomycetes bacterium Pla133]QDV01506.1 tRNA 5-methylaminomethyl-2-thiouridine biosynthesis bifunctional protein MnmC [Planctomycetes bacterium Pla86]
MTTNREVERGWRPVRTADGSLTALHPIHGQAAHDLEGARSEARSRYARPCLLDLVEPGATVRLLDVGSGLGLNLAAALEAVEGHGARLQAVGLELDRRALECAAAMGPDPEPGFERAWSAVRLAFVAALEGRGGVLGFGARSSIELHLGDAAAALAGDRFPGPFDAIFLDGYAPALGGALWDPPFLAALAERLAPHGRLATYTASARVRAGMLAAGLALGLPERVGRKGAGTLAGWKALDGPRVSALDRAQAAKLDRRAERLRVSPGGGKPDGGA